MKSEIILFKSQIFHCSDLYLFIYFNCIIYILDFFLYCHFATFFILFLFDVTFWLFCYFCLALCYNIMHSSPFFQEVLLDLALQRLLGVPAESRKRTKVKNRNKFPVLKSQRNLNESHRIKT